MLRVALTGSEGGQGSFKAVDGMDGRDGSIGWAGGRDEMTSSVFQVFLAVPMRLSCVPESSLEW